MLDGLLYGNRRARRHAGALRRVRGDVETYARDLEDWLSEHDVPDLREAVVRDECAPGALVTAELDWNWSEVARERAQAHGGEPVRSTFWAHLHNDDADSVDVSGTFDPRKLTCSTSNVELAGRRRQWVLGHVAAACEHAVELRPVAIATLLLAPPPGRWDPDWRRVHPRQIDQWSAADWDLPVPDEALAALSGVPRGASSRPSRNCSESRSSPPTGVARRTTSTPAG